MHGRHGQRQRGVEVLAQIAKVRRQADAGLAGRLAQPGVRGFQCAERLGRQLRRQHRLVDLDPLGPRGRQPADHLGIDRQNGVQQGQRLDLGRTRLAQQQERHRPDQHRPRADAQGQRFVKVIQRLGRGQAEPHARLELRHQVMVVRVEPLGHVQRRNLVRAAGHGEVGGQVDRLAVPGEPLRHRAEHRGRVEHQVVEREIVRRDVLDAGVALQFPMPPAELLGGGLQVRRDRSCRSNTLRRRVSTPAGRRSAENQDCSQWPSCVELLLYQPVSSTGFQPVSPQPRWLCYEGYVLILYGVSLWPAGASRPSRPSAAAALPAFLSAAAA